MKSVVASKAAAALRSIAKPLDHSLPTRSLKESPELCCLTLKVFFTCHHSHSSGCSAFILSHKSHKSQQASFVAAANHKINAFIFVLVFWQIQASLRSETSFNLKSTNSILTSKYADLQSYNKLPVALYWRSNTIQICYDLHRQHFLIVWRIFFFCNRHEHSPACNAILDWE